MFWKSAPSVEYYFTVSTENGQELGRVTALPTREAYIQSQKCRNAVEMAGAQLAYDELQQSVEGAFALSLELGKLMFPKTWTIDEVRQYISDNPKDPSSIEMAKVLGTRANDTQAERPPDPPVKSNHKREHFCAWLCREEGTGEECYTVTTCELPTKAEVCAMMRPGEQLADWQQDSLHLSWISSHINRPWANSIGSAHGSEYLGRRLYRSDLVSGNAAHEAIYAAAHQCTAVKEVKAEKGPRAEFVRLADVDVPILPDDVANRLLAIGRMFTDRHQASPKGVLLKGPPGTGKTMTGRYIAALVGGAFFDMSTSDLKKGFIGQSGAAVQELWANVARHEGVSVVFVDECEILFGARGGDADSFIEEIVGEFLPRWTAAKAGQVLVIGATNRPELLDPAIVDRFTFAIELPSPPPATRLKILASVFAAKGIEHLMTEVDSEQLAEMTQGKAGRELENFASIIAVEAEVHARRATLADFNAAAKQLHLQASSGADDSVSWDTLILDPALQRELKRTCAMLADCEKATAKGWTVPRSILLDGPPGTGKTLVAKVMAKESGINFLEAKGTDFKGKYSGHTGPAVQAKFAEARRKAPCILFIDEIESALPQRGGEDSFAADAVTTFLTELDGAKTATGAPVFVLGATNHPDAIDSAVLSRFAKKLHIGLPVKDARIGILKNLLAGKPQNFSENDFVRLADMTEGYSGRDLRSLCENAEMNAIDEFDGDFDSARLKIEHFTDDNT